MASGLITMYGLLLFLLISTANTDPVGDALENQFTIQTTVTLNCAKQIGGGVTCTCAPTSDAVKAGATDLQTEDKITAAGLPPGYKLYGGKGYCYKLHKAGESWQTANKICEEAGGHLAVIDSKEEEEVVVDLLQEYKGTGELILVGFHDLVNEGQHQTVFGEPLDSLEYVNWADGEPDDLFGFEDCGAIDSTGQLRDVLCPLPRPFLCELPLWATTNLD